MPRITRVCKGENCDNKFETYSSQNKRYCSPSCRYSDPKLSQLLTETLSTKHFLNNIDPVALTAICENCGPTKIRKRTEIRAYGREIKWRCRRAEQIRDWAQKYGLSKVDIEKQLKEQDGKCAICSYIFEDDFRVDHCHNTKIVRKLLCTNCNTGLGQFKDDPKLMRLAANYVEQYH